MIRKTAVIVVAVIAFFVVPLGAMAGGEFKLTSPHIKDGGRIKKAQVFNGFGCKGKNISPALRWKNPPPGTKSFAVTAYDPDAPTGSGWWHWLVFNIPAKAKGLRKNAGNPALDIVPKGSIQSRTDYDKPGYGGPCPPRGHGEHRYIFTVYALDVKELPLGADVSPARVGFHINRHTISKASLTGIYGR